MYAKMKKLAVLSITLCAFLLGLGQVSGIDFPEKRPPDVETPEKRPQIVTPPDKRPGGEIEDAASEAGERSEGALPNEEIERDEDNGIVADQPLESETPDQVTDASPPMPLRAPPFSLRNPRIAREPFGPPPPAQSWTGVEIAQAKQQCERLIDTAAIEFKPRDPIRDGICGAPAPIRLTRVGSEPETRIKPAATVRCRVADAVNRWMAEVVQPSARALLDDSIVSVTNVSSYRCRTRYNDPSKRMSEHAYANAIDISAFDTAKGDRVILREHWDGDAPKAKFLKAVHAGACEIFGTVLGPEANAAHRDHFHFDMKKRRYSAYCE